ncbi:MAG: hypothetical protein ABUS79_14890 [Pseudomonadota bacterium]
MSIEYVAPVTLTEDQVATLEAEVRADGRWIQEGTLVNGKLSYRIAGRPRRAAWPEDFSLYLSPPNLEVAFHSATRTERENFLSFLSDTLQRITASHVNFEDA